MMKPNSVYLSNPLYPLYALYALYTPYTPRDALYRCLCQVLFINFPGLSWDEGVLDRMQQLMRLMQESLYRHEGSLRQFIMDDKGTTLIGVFGL